MIKTITLAILMIALSGCNSIKESRIRSDILSDPNIKPEIKYLIEKREVRYGMTKEQVQAAWGYHAGGVISHENIHMAKYGNTTHLAHHPSEKMLALTFISVAMANWCLRLKVNSPTYIDERFKGVIYLNSTCKCTT